jgi:uncharacterized protein YbjT (DUF2867 family)
MRILIAGASGYIGQALMAELLKSHQEVEITALSRGPKHSDDARVHWKACDLFSLKSLEQAVPKEIDVVYYLVHSMGPTAQMDQGSFADYDLILADNFARILKTTDVKHLIYLGGLIPEHSHLSLHLKSRLEVEETFNQAMLPLTVFRAGLIIGQQGSSFQILSKLVDRLPIMICPKWTQTLTTPVDLDSVVTALASSISNSSAIGRVYDLAGCEPLTYVQMMRETARRLRRKRWFLTVPFFTPTLSRLWVRLITGAPKELVYPLVESLEHPMVARADHLYRKPHPGSTYYSLLEGIDIADHNSPKKREPFRAQRKTVRSVQRLPLPAGRNAEWLKDQYIIWLPKFLAPFVKVAIKDDHIRFALLNSKFVMLDLALNRERSTPDRQLLYVAGGLLSADDNKGRLEFRAVASLVTLSIFSSISSRLGDAKFLSLSFKGLMQYEKSAYEILSLLNLFIFFSLHQYRGLYENSRSRRHSKVHG